MSSFTKPISYTRSPDGQWVTGEQFTYEVGKKGSGIKIIVPKGFKTDMGSIPRIFRIFFSPTDIRWYRACVLHDHLYRSGIVSRAIADAVFLEAMRANKKNPTPRWVAWLFYVMVRLFGWRFFRKHEG